MIEPLTPEAVAYVAGHMRARDQREILACHWPGQEYRTTIAGALASRPTAWTASANGKPACAFGASATRPGVWSVWAFATDDFPLVGFPVTKFIRRCMIPGLIAAGAHRAECLTLAEHHSAHRWLESLGACREATLKEFGRAGEDFHIYVWRR